MLHKTPFLFHASWRFQPWNGTSALWQLSLIAALVAGSGCAQTPKQARTRIWPNVPGTPWTGEQQEPAPEEPATMAANRPAVEDTALMDNHEPADSALASAATTPAEKKRSLWRPDWRRAKASEAGVQTAEVETTAAADDAGEDSETMPVGGIAPEGTNPLEAAAADVTGMEAPGASTQVERLRAALDVDARRAEHSLTEALPQDEMRLRIDSLMLRAARLLEAGEIETALRSVRLAVELSDAAKIEFAPDEQRPIDLLRLIEDAQEQMQQVEEVGSASISRPATTSSEELAPPAGAVTVRSNKPATRGAAGTARSLGAEGTVGPVAGANQPATLAASSSGLDDASSEHPWADPFDDVAATTPDVGQVAYRDDQPRVSANRDLRTARATSSDAAGGMPRELVDMAPAVVAANEPRSTARGNSRAGSTASSELRSAVDIAAQDAQTKIAGPKAFQSVARTSLAEQRQQLSGTKSARGPDRELEAPPRLLSGGGIPWRWVAIIALLACVPICLRWTGLSRRLN